MKRKAILLLMAATLSCSLTFADNTASTALSRRITVREAVQLALNTTTMSALQATRSMRNNTRKRPRRVPISHQYAMTAAFCV